MGIEAIAAYAATAASAASAVTGIYSATKKPETPDIKREKSVRDEDERILAQKRSIAEQQAKSGRQSTILTAFDSDKLGG
jgi:hypothetical protein